MCMNIETEWPHNWYGFWKYGTSLPFPGVKEAVDHSWSHDKRSDIIAYLKHGLCVCAIGTQCPCELCGQQFPVTFLSDGDWVWPTSLAHLVECHSVLVPRRFVDHMIRKSFNLPTEIVLPIGQLPWPEGSAMKQVPSQ